MSEPTKYTPREVILQAHQQHPTNVRKGAAACGISRASYRERLQKLGLWTPQAPSQPTILAEPIPTTDEPLEDLIARRRAQGKRVRSVVEHGTLTRVKVNQRGPVGILHIGDPHLDDDGCDFDRLWTDIELVERTEGLFAGIIGDLSNNWVGRLARLYADQNTSAANAWRLVEEMLRRLGPKLLYLVAGNHDVWSGAGDPLRWIMRYQPGVFQPHGIRLEFSFPEGQPVRMSARHDWPGGSQYNPAFGAGKAAFRGLGDHLIVGGHRHQSGYFTFYNEHNGVLSHCIQVGSYKTLDNFALERGFTRNNSTPAVVTIIHPEADCEHERVHVYTSAPFGIRVLEALRRVS
jgi:hypothetical protein